MVVVGLNGTEPLADVAAKLPGVIATLVAPEVAQLSVVPAPAVMAVGLALNDAIAGAGSCLTVGIGAVHPAIPAHAASNSPIAQITGPGILRKRELTFLFQIERTGSMRAFPSIAFQRESGWKREYAGPGGVCFVLGAAMARMRRDLSTCRWGPLLQPGPSSCAMPLRAQFRAGSAAVAIRESM